MKRLILRVFLAMIILLVPSFSVFPQQTITSEQVKNLSAEPQVKAWEEFYKTELGYDVDFSQVKIPGEKEGFDQLIIVVKGITIKKAFNACKEKFDCSSIYSNLNKAVTKNDREPKEGHYAIWIRDRVQADEELKSMSAIDLQKENIPGITLLERLLYELFYFEETGEHLDIKNFTICSGSRDSDGRVPDVCWYPGSRKLGVLWCFPNSRLDYQRSRAVVE